MERVVAIRRVETDFDVILAAFVALQDRADVRTEVALDLQDQAPDLALRIARLAAERLFDGRIQTG